MHRLTPEIMRYRFRSTATLILTAALAFSQAGAAAFHAGRLVQVSGPSPFADCTADSGQPGTNFPNTEVEPWVAVNPINPDNVVAAWMQDQWTANAARGIVAGVSFDAGKTWQNVVIPGITKCSGGSYDRTGDPWLAFAPNGDLYLSSLGVGVTSTGAFSPSAVLVHKSTDGGMSWSEPTILIEEAGPLHDKESITADPSDPNRVYAVWSRNFGGFPGTEWPTMFSRTSDGGLSWEPARVIHDAGWNFVHFSSQIFIPHDGTLINIFNEGVFRDSSAGGFPRFDFSLAVSRSPDGGDTWLPEGTPIRAVEMLSACTEDTIASRIRCVTDPDTGQFVRDASLTYDAAIDPNNGNLYLEWLDGRFSNFQNQSVAFSMSTDGGLTWSAPIKVNRTPTGIAPVNQQAFGHSIHVARDGTIGVAYYDFRFNDPAAGALTDYWIVHCHPTTPTACTDPANWRDETRLTEVSFDIGQAPALPALFLGDYQGMDAAGRGFGAVFSQPHGSDQASVFFREVSPRPRPRTR